MLDKKIINLLVVLPILFLYSACVQQKQAPSVETSPENTVSDQKSKDGVTDTRDSDEELAQRYALAYSFDRTHALMVTYGPEARPEEGDDDSEQIFHIMIPTSYTDELYLRLFDPDCGDSLDFSHYLATTTRFALYGGSQGDQLIHQADFGQDGLTDNSWQLFTSLNPADGTLEGAYRVFKLRVKGLNGAKGNVYNLAVSRNRVSNLPPSGLRIINYAPTLLLNAADTAAELRFMVPETPSLHIKSYDGAGAALSFETATRSLELNRSGQGTHTTTEVTIEPDEQEKPASLLLMANGADSPNVVTFSIKETDGSQVAVELPVYAGPANTRPEIALQHDKQADCRSIAFDAGASTDKDGDLLKFLWDFGDGQQGKGARIVHPYEGSGIYQVTLRVNDSSGRIGHASVKTFPVEIDELPNASAGADQIVAPGETVHLDGSGSTVVSQGKPHYKWIFGDGNKDHSMRSTHKYIYPGLYPVTLRVSDPLGGPCSWDEDTLSVRVNDTPLAEAGDDQLAAPSETIVLDSRGSYDPDGDLAGFLWDFGDGSRAEGSRTEHSYTTSGTYTVTLTVTDHAGVANSTAKDQLQVFVNQAPVARAGGDRRLAAGESTLFDGSASADSDGYIAAYQWDFGDQESGRGMRVPYSYSKPGTYTVKLRVLDNTAGQDGEDSDTLTVIVNNPPVAHVKGEKLVTGTRVRFSGADSVDQDGELISYRWDFGDGRKGVGREIVHPYTRSGVYTVTLTVQDDSGTGSDTATEQMSVIVNQRPVADAGPDPLQVAPGEKLTFGAKDSYDPDGAISDFEWSLDGKKIGDGAVTEQTFAQPGVYRLNLKIKDDANDERAVDYDEVLVRVNAPPTSNAGPDIVAAPGDPVLLDGSASFDPDGSLSLYQWKFNDNQVLEGSPIAKRTFSEAGLYSAVLTVVDDSGAANGMAQDEVAIFINHAPTAVAGKDQFTCDVAIRFNGSDSVDPDGDVLTYEWDFGDGHKARGQQVKHIYAQGGAYPVGLVVDDGHGLANSRHSAAMVVTINRPPIAVAGDAITGCAGVPIIFNGSGSTDMDGDPLSYGWDLGNSKSADIVNPSTIYAKGGHYEARLTVRDDSALECDTDMDTVSVLVAQSPTADAGPDRKVCANTRVSFDGSKSYDIDGVVNAYIWNFGDNGRSEGPTPEHIFTEPGQYNVTLTVRGDETAGSQCDMTHTDEAIVTVRQAPVARINAESIIGVNESGSYDASASMSKDAPIVSYAWDFADGTTAEGSMVEHTFSKVGRYTVALVITTDSNDECREMLAELPVVVNGGPVADGGPDRLVAVDEPVRFSGAGSVDNDGAITAYHWDFGDGEVGKGINVQHRYRKAGVYTASLTVADNTVADNSSDKTDIKVTVNHPPVVRITAPDHACPQETTLLSGVESTDADGSIINYGWDFGDTSVAEGTEISHVYEKAGSYNLTLTVEDDSNVLNSIQQQSMVLPVNHQPVARAGADQLVCPGEEVVFDGSGSRDQDGTITSFRWDFKDGGTFEEPQASHVFSSPGAYNVSLQVRDDTDTSCGMHEDHALVRVNAPPVAVAGPDQKGWTGGAHDALFFDGSGSRDPDKDALVHHWEFGDGTGGGGAKVYHTYTSPGKYLVRLTVSDSSGLDCGRVSDELEVEIRERE